MNQQTDNHDSAGAIGEGQLSTAGSHGLGWKATLLVCCVIVLLGAGAVAMIFYTEPSATRAGATKETAMLVEVTAARAGTFRPHIVATGTVRPSQEIVLRPRVDGEVVERSAEFVPGGIVDAGEVVLRLDPSDYRNALRQRKNELDQAKAELRVEMGRQNVAEQEYRLLEETLSEGTLSEENRALMLRQPQLDAARSRVESARAALEQARLELERTTIEAPFDAQVLSRAVNVGSQVAAGDELAHLVGAEEYWIKTAVPVSKLKWLDIPDNGRGAEVRVRNRAAWEDGGFRTGYVYKLIGTLEDQTRMARVLVVVEDPLAQQARNAGEPRLMLGAYVETRLQGEALSDVVRLERDYVRQNDTVWVMQDGELDIRDVEIVVRDREHAYIRDGLSEGERVVTSDLATIQDGAPLRVDGGAGTGETTGGPNNDPSRGHRGGDSPS